MNIPPRAMRRVRSKLLHGPAGVVSHVVMVHVLQYLVAGDDVVSRDVVIV